MNNKRVIIDYLSVTFAERYNNLSDRNEAYLILDIFREYFKLDMCQIEESNYAVNNFRYQFILNKYIILRCCGPLNDFGYRTCQLELKGDGCREFERLKEGISSWYDFFEFLMGFNPTFKRIDITIDDISGKEMPLKYLYDKIEGNAYTSIFKTEPKILGTLKRGLTIDFGSRNSKTELCIYDKYKQQRTLKKEVPYEYWTRYEMRFRQGKADAIVLDLLENYKDEEDVIYGIRLKAFATKALYSILDIKENSKPDKNHLYREKTDSKWLSFLETTEKGILPKAEMRKSTSETSYNYIMPKAKMILLLWFVEAKCDKQLFEERLYHELFTLLSNTSRMQLKRFNQFMIERKMSTYTDEAFKELLKEISKIIEEGELPF
ncbi:replication initiation factor [Anaeroplasma bactoclasticum]|jgi:phage replication initiation protein|uniref:Replication initiation factor n=1 Tax=Anaeroplasma bactoclasticum TaxID=2088 RepID=A0A397S6P6_9MOLU|nr:replication initiation factor domain-containing protein [Anaeroplasma bactoclasticum]RIA77934.1 replication initiation factor [Anaeroplasma bactoclasticum]